MTEEIKGAVAQALKENKANAKLIGDISRICKQSNSNFDSAKFYMACTDD